MLPSARTFTAGISTTAPRGIRDDDDSDVKSRGEGGAAVSTPAIAGATPAIEASKIRSLIMKTPAQRLSKNTGS